MNRLLRRPIPYEKKKSLAGYGFIGLWLIGFFLIYAKPLVQSLYYSFQELVIKVGGFETRPIGWANYIKAFTGDEKFLPALTETVLNMVYQTPIILVFSLLMSLMINQKFKGRTIVRAIFFLPIIIASGIVINIINGDYMSQTILSGEKSSQLFQVTAFYDMLYGIGFSRSLVDFIIGMANNIFELSWRSGIQILLFLAGLQVIPRNLYEAASVDGGTKWEMFWKITFPMITPLLMVNVIYTITDSFTSYNNKVMQLILASAREDMKFAYSSTLAWIYFLVIIVVMGIVFGIFNRHVVYTD